MMPQGLLSAAAAGVAFILSAWVSSRLRPPQVLGRGVVLGLLVAAVVVARPLRAFSMGWEGTGALVAAVGVGVASVRWSTRGSEEMGRRSAGVLALLCLLGVVGALAAGGTQSPWAILSAGLVVGLAWGHLALPWRGLVPVSLLVMAAPLLAGEFAPMRVQEAFATIGAGALLGLLALQAEPVSPRAWPLLLVGIAAAALSFIAP